MSEVKHLAPNSQSAVHLFQHFSFPFHPILSHLVMVWECASHHSAPRLRRRVQLSRRGCLGGWGASCGKHRESTEPESHQTAKMFFFLLLLQKGQFKFARLFHDGFCTKQQHFPLSSAPVHRFFSRFEVTRGDSNRSLKNYGFLYDAIFLQLYACAQITQQRNVIIMQDC